MTTTYYPAILSPADTNGLYGVEVPSINVNGSGDSAESALANAAAVLQEVIDDLFASGEDVTTPETLNPIKINQGTLPMIQFPTVFKTVLIIVLMHHLLL